MRKNKISKKGGNGMEKINQYIDSIFYKKDDLLEDVLLSIKENDMPPISVSPSTGKLLTLLVSISGAKNILEIGALGGYSGICLARGFGEDGHLTSLELKENYANLALQNLSKAGFANQVTYMIGPALDNLERLKNENKRFDFFFIDADKRNYENYLHRCIELAEDGALIVCDNAFAGGSVFDETMKERGYTEIMREFNQTVANHPKLCSTLIPIGDGLIVAKVEL